jgi:hypothetical protein
MALPYFENPEKKYHEKWYEGRDIRNLPRPYRHLIVGMPNCGKTMLTLSTICQTDKPYDEILLLHGSTFDSDYVGWIALEEKMKKLKISEKKDKKISKKNTALENVKVENEKEIEKDNDEKGEIDDGIEFDEDEYKNVLPKEYADIEFSAILKGIPMKYTYFGKWQNEEGSKHNLLIIDDVDLSNFKTNKNIQRLNKIFSMMSTHKNLTIIVSVQSLLHVPNQIRGYMNVVTLFNTNNGYVMEHYARNMGMTKAKMTKLFDELKTPHDCITFDKTTGSPYPIRLNFVINVEFKTKEVDRETKKNKKTIQYVSK